MFKKIKLLLYYVIISKLPHSRYSMAFNFIRTWYVVKCLGIMKAHKHNYFENNVYIGDSTEVNVGYHCHINENVFIQGAEIGNFVMIAPNVSILSSTHNHDRTDIPMIMQGEIKRSKVYVGDDVWIGRNVIIMPGITIGKGSIVGAGAVVTKDIPDYSIAVGVPAKVIKTRT